MKKSVLIAIILIVVLGGVILISTHHDNATVVAPTTTDTTTTAPTPADQIPETTGTKASPSTVTIANGQSGVIEGITIKVVSVTEDSRCPTNTVCVQAGSVALKTTVTKGKITTTHIFATNSAPYAFEGYTISLAGVYPVPTTPNPIKLQDYRFTFQAVPTPKI